MIRIYLYVTAIILLLSLHAFAQNNASLKQNRKSVDRLRIGDVLPEVVLSPMLNYDKAIKNLSDYKGKFIILDFWNVACKSCIAAFPKMESLQRKYSKDLQVLLVTSDDFEKIEKLHSKSPIFKNVTLPILYNDSILNNVLFPHQGEPFIVIVDREGKIIIKTEGNELNEANIVDLIAGKKNQFHQREELDNELTKDLLNENFRLFSLINQNYSSCLKFYDDKAYKFLDYEELKAESQYSLFFKPLPGSFSLPSSPVQLKDIEQRNVGLRIINKPLFYILQMAYNNPRVLSGEPLVNRMVVDNENLNWILPPAKEIDRYDWWKKTALCYELVLSAPSDPKIQFRTLQLDIEKYLQIRVSIEKRNIPCIIIKHNSSVKSIFKINGNGTMVYEDTKSSKGIILENVSSGSLSGIVRSYYPDYEVVNETKLKSTDKFSFNIQVVHMDNFEELNSTLKKFGFTLEKAERMIDVMVIGRKVNNN